MTKCYDCHEVDMKVRYAKCYLCDDLVTLCTYCKSRVRAGEIIIFCEACE